MEGQRTSTSRRTQSDTGSLRTGAGAPPRLRRARTSTGVGGTRSRRWATSALGTQAQVGRVGGAKAWPRDGGSAAPEGATRVRSGPGDAGGRPSRGVVASLCPQQGGGHAPGMSWGPRRPRPSMLQDWQRAGAAGPASPRPTGQVSRQCLRTLTPTSPSCHGTVTPQRGAFSTFDTSLRAKRFLLIELGFDEC